MTHDQYLERHHELANEGLGVIATMLGAERYADATTATTNLRQMLDALYEQRREVAERAVAP